MLKCLLALRCADNDWSTQEPLPTAHGCTPYDVRMGEGGQPRTVFLTAFALSTKSTHLSEAKAYVCSSTYIPVDATEFSPGGGRPGQRCERAQMSCTSGTRT
jgi:hypothetical protein